jgi:nicotinamide-nucleotide amidase
MSTPDDSTLSSLARQTGALLKKRGVMLACAESCTGGYIAQMLTSIPGSSEWFERGFVTYTNLAKHEMLRVPAAALETHGAVSEPTVRAMAEGALTHSHAQVSLAVSGVAGPSGGTPGKPVGTVCLAWAGKGRETQSRTEHFNGDRDAVRRAAVQSALQGMLDFLASDE